MIAPSTAEGTTYVVSVSGTKFYTQVSRPETAVGFTNVATWQVLDLEIEGDRLTYRAYDRQGRIRDAFVIEKGAETGTAAETSARTINARTYKCFITALPL